MASQSGTWKSVGIAGKPSNGKPLPANESEENLRFLENGNRFAFFEALNTLNMAKVRDSALLHPHWCKIVMSGLIVQYSELIFMNHLHQKTMNTIKSWIISKA